MNKNIVIPIVLFLLSALLTLMFNPVTLFVVGTGICIFAVLKNRVRKITEPSLGANVLFRSGLAVIAGAIVAIAFVFAAMSGLFGK